MFVFVDCFFSTMLSGRQTSLVYQDERKDICSLTLALPPPIGEHFRLRSSETLHQLPVSEKTISFPPTPIDRVNGFACTNNIGYIK